MAAETQKTEGGRVRVRVLLHAEQFSTVKTLTKVIPVQGAFGGRQRADKTVGKHQEQSKTIRN